MVALTWIAPGQELEALARQPAACLAPTADDSLVRAGRALFNAPQLLGGQAARADVSCASCHANGRVSRHFHLEGVSDAPGTADVGSSFFSTARANDRFDPKPIPDLAMPGKVSRDPVSGELEEFLRGLIVEEFAGRDPGAASLAALAAYVRAVGPCADAEEEKRGLAGQVALVRDSVTGAISMAERGETAAAVLLAGAARSQLGLINERLVGPRLDRERNMLLAASRRLQPIAEAGAPDPGRLRAWLDDFDSRIVPRLERVEARSLYDPERLKDYLRKIG
jgi:hypothetical protein